MTVERTARILIVGAGGIGGLAFELIVPALEKVGQKCSITIMDGDTVEASNLGHQRFSALDIGSHKTTALVKKYESFKHVYCISDTENLRVKEQLQDFDYIIIGVDRPHPRRLVHGTDVPWIDLRSTGDGHVYFHQRFGPCSCRHDDAGPRTCELSNCRSNRSWKHPVWICQCRCSSSNMAHGAVEKSASSTRKNVEHHVW